MSAQQQSSQLTRREMFGRLFRPLQRAVQPAMPRPVGGNNQFTTNPDAVAVIAGRHCLAYQGTGCSVCHERCPVAGAIVLMQGLPRVIADVCTGCRICHEVCPAPENAILMVARPAGLPKLVGRDKDSPAMSPFPHLPGGGHSRV